MEKTKLAKAAVDAFKRASQDKVEAARVIADPEAAKSVRLAVKPPKVSSGLKKAGVLLIVTPDPLTAIPGVAMLGASYVMKKREPAGLEDLVRETKKTLRDLESLL